MARVIELIVSPRGEITLQTKGYSGQDCLQASKFLEQSLGTVTADKKTPECYLAAPGGATRSAVRSANHPTPSDP